MYYFGKIVDSTRTMKLVELHFANWGTAARISTTCLAVTVSGQPVSKNHYNTFPVVFLLRVVVHSEHCIQIQIELLHSS
jgi:hypothetical protein